MNQFTDFIHRLAAWRKEQGTLPVNEPGDSAESQWLNLEQRKRFFQAKVIEKKREHLQALVTDAESRMKALQEDLLRLKNQTELKVPVATGEMLSFDLSQHQLFRAFVQQPAVNPVTAQRQYYDPALLPQESDDLLFYV